MCEQTLPNEDQLVCKRTMVAAEHMNACIYTDPLEPRVREVAKGRRRPDLYFLVQYLLSEDFKDFSIFFEGNTSLQMSLDNKHIMVVLFRR